MPATYIGNATNFTSAVSWNSGQSKSLGDLVTPSAKNGLVAICVVAGTTVTQPLWNTPPYPLIGTIFAESGGPTWMIYATQPGAFPPILQLPVDADNPIAYNSVIPGQTIADQLAWLEVNTGLLAGDNVWTGINEFKGPIISDLNSPNISFLFDGDYGGDDTHPVFEGDTDPGSDPGNVTRITILKFNCGFGMYGRLFADNSPGLSSTAGLTLTINAGWVSGAWAQDNTGNDALIITFGNDDFAVTGWPAGTSFSSAVTYVDVVVATSGPGISANAITTDTTDYPLSALSPGDIGCNNLKAHSDVIASSVICTSVIANNTPRMISPGVVSGVTLTGGAVDLFGGSLTVPAAGLYELKVYLSGSGVWNGNWAADIAYPGYSTSPGTIYDGGGNMPTTWTDASGSTGTVGGLTIPFYANAAGAVTLTFHVSTGAMTGAGCCIQY